VLALATGKRRKGGRLRQQEETEGEGERAKGRVTEWNR
jgi:hypothetical protein